LLVLSTGGITLGAWATPAPSTSGLQADSSIAQTPVSAKVIYVNSANGTDSTSAGTTEANPVRTITYALQQAAPGTIIQLAPGSYTTDTGEVFPLIVKQGVVLRGDEATKGQRVAIIGGGNYISRLEANQSVSVKAEQDSEVNGVTITNPNTRGTGLWIESSNTIARNNSFINSMREGVFITGTATPKIEDNLFSKNQGNGISAGRNSRGEIRNNVFDNTGFAIALSEEASPLIEQNRIVQNVDGIVAASDTAPILRNNIIESNKRDGLVAVSNARPDLGTAESPGNNRIRNNTRYDINNSTRSNILVAYGNDVNQQRILGRVDLVAATIPGNGFPDVQGHWAQAYIQALAAKDIIAGFPDGTFRPSEPVTRAQFAAIINKAFAPASQRSATNFVDVRSNYWAYKAIQTAYQGGFLAGYPGQVFKPEQRIPRVQVLVSLASGLDLRSNSTTVLSVYNDVAQIPSYAATAIAGATQKGLVVNYPTPNQLNPNREATRADVAAFVYQALVNAGRVPAIPSPYVVKSL
jgi:parallel beta-helix repeat protein